MAYFDPRAWPEKNQQIYHRYLEQLASFVEWLVSRPYRVVLFPGGAVADRGAIQDLKQKLDLRQVGSSARIDDPVIESVDDLLRTIIRTDLVVATRLHSVILAHLCSKPVLALSYHQKVSAVMDDMGHSEYCLDVQSLDTEALIHSFQRLEGNRALLSSQIKDRIGAYRRELAAQYDSVFSTG
jgi:polysaccharide pyruvyl transferase WcaK-like protein